MSSSFSPTRTRSASSFGSTKRIITGALAAGLAFTCLSPLTNLPDASADTQHVVNGTFGAGVAGWKTNSSQQVLEHVSNGRNGGAASLSPASGTAGVVLNDQKPTLTNVAAGRTFTVSAWVKAKEPGVGGHLRVRAVTEDAVDTHRQYFNLTDTQWTKVSFSFTNTAPGADFDLNVLAYDLASSNALLIDDVTLMSGAQALDVQKPEVAPNQDIAGDLTNGGTYDEIGIPSKGAYFGATVGSNSDPASFEKEVGGKLGIRRTFYSATQVNSAVKNAKSDIANKRIPWISFKLPHSWKDMAAGKGDAWAKDLAAKLDALDGPVWLAFHHEPEGDGPIKDWVAMQKHLSPIVKKNSDNVALSIILTGWHQTDGEAQYSLENLWPGSGVIDILGFDPYNFHETEKNGKIRGSSPMDKYFDHFAAFAKKKNVEWGVAETGINNEAARKDPEWMQRTYDQIVARDGIAMSYFNTHLNSSTTWQITDSVKTKQFGQVLKGSTKIK